MTRELTTMITPTADRPTPRKPSPRWQTGDTVLDGKTRWIIRILTRDGRVELSSANTVNADIWWKTTIDKLPEKRA